MADAFERLLTHRNGLPGLGKFQRIYREIACKQGRPDFIALRLVGGRSMGIPTSLGYVGAEILSMLKPKSPRTLDYILTHSGHTESTVRSAIRSLLDQRYIRATSTGSYLLEPRSRSTKLELLVFELKLDNPKRAIFQAKQARAYAQRAIIVIPPSQLANYGRFDDVMKRWGIGLATFDPHSSAFEVCRRSKKLNPLSKSQHLYALSRLIT